MILENEWLFYVMALAFAMGSLFLLLGYMFGLVVIPSLVSSPKWKYVALISSIVVPPLVAVICLMNYKRTAYASRFILLGLLAMALGVLCMYYLGGTLGLPKPIGVA